VVIVAVFTILRRCTVFADRLTHVGEHYLFRFKRILHLAAIWLARLYLLLFFIFAILFLPEHRYLVGALLQQVFIAALIFFRLRRGKVLFMIPDEMLACLPYFWALTTLGSAENWFAGWQAFFLPVFAISFLAILDGSRKWFAGGLRRNSLLQAIYCALVFVLVFATALRNVFPPFDIELYRETVLNTVAFFAGIPVCLAAVGVKRNS